MKIQIEEFNTAPGAQALTDYLKKNNLDEILEVTDAKREFWQNKHDTLVLSLIEKENGRRAITFNDGLALGEMAWEFGADEFDSIVEDYRTYYRIWWD